MNVLGHVLHAMWWTEARMSPIFRICNTPTYVNETISDIVDISYNHFS